MRESWTDARLDDFVVHVDRRFDAVDKRFDAMDRRFEAVDKRFDAMDQRFNSMDQRFDALQRTMLQIAGGTIATLIAGFAGVIATQL